MALPRRQPARASASAITPLERVGVYVPGGHAAYPSSVLMNVDPGARRRRAARSITVSPAGPRRPPAGHPRRLPRRRRRRGLPRRRRAGGGGAGLRHRDDPARRQDRRPGQRLRRDREAARATARSTSTRSPGRARCWSSPTAPPTPALVAADLLAQAEHDPLARRRVRDDRPPARRRASRRRSTSSSPRCRAGASPRARWRASARSSSCASLAEAVALANRLAPEHLELLVRAAAPLAAAHPPRRRDLPRPGRAGGVRRLPGRTEPRAADRRHGALLVAARRVRLRQAHQHDRGRAADAARGSGRPSPAWRGWRGSTRTAARSSAGSPGRGRAR